MVLDPAVQPSTPLDDIIASLDLAQVLGYQVIFHIYNGDADTNLPWYLDSSGQWVFPQSGIACAICSNRCCTFRGTIAATTRHWKMHQNCGR